MDEQAFAQIGSALSDIVQNAAPGPFAAAPSGSFSYSPDQLRDLVNEWVDLAHDYDQSRADGEQLTQVRGPGTESVSDSLASVANSSGQAFLQSLKDKSDYCWLQAQKLQDALDDYLGLEHHNLRKLNDAGPKDGF